MSVPTLPSLGLELELPVATRRDGTTADARPALATLLEREARHGARALRTANGTLVGVQLAHALVAFDNGYNNLEIALDPLLGRDATLNELARRATASLTALTAALAEHGLVVLNLAEHPVCGTAPELYRRMRCPKTIYLHWEQDRQWDHACGIDAKAQNGPTTGMQPGRAAVGLNTVLRAAPAFIALFANSPFEAGARTAHLENRLTLWPRMFAPARHAADRRLATLPPRPFVDLGNYFRWLFGADTVMHALHPRHGSYKTPGELIVPTHTLSLEAFLTRRTALPARRLPDGQPAALTPSLRHFEQLQFTHFLDTRIRFGLATLPAVEDFLAAWNRPHGLEAVFAEHCSHVYLEGRVPGATFADAHLIRDAGDTVAASAPLAPSALQAGLLAAGDAAVEALTRLVPWPALAGLREAAMRDGLAGEHAGVRVREVVDCVLELAYAGLSADEHWTLAYAEHVRNHNENAAQRALKQVAAHPGPLHEALTALIHARHVRVVAPPRTNADLSAAAAR